MPAYTILALDLEGTLISNAVSQIARPGLFRFLEQCKDLFPRIVIFTTVPESRFRTIARLLASEEQAPEWFAHLEYVSWSGKTKDLGLVQSADARTVLLVDDFPGYVHPGQDRQWVPIEHFDFPYGDDDTGLADVLEVLEQLLQNS